MLYVFFGLLLLAGPCAALGLFETANPFFVHTPLLLALFAFHLPLTLNDCVVAGLFCEGPGHRPSRHILSGWVLR